MTSVKPLYLCRYVCESGGRIFLADSCLPTAAPLREDLAWRQQHSAVTGPLHQDAVAPTKRAGKLWELYAELEGEGWKPDATSYTTAFRWLPLGGVGPDKQVLLT